MDGFPSDQWQYAAWVVGRVVMWRWSRPGHQPDDWGPLASDYLRLWMPERAIKPVMDRLVKAGVLECDGAFWPATKTKPGKALCYRLGPAWRDAAVGPLRLTHVELRRRCAAQRPADPTDSVHLGLKQWLAEVQTTPDAPFGVDPSLDHLIDSADDPASRRFKVCGQGRVHTDITSMACHCRQFIRVAGQELVSVDVNAAQPLLLGVSASSPTPNHPPLGQPNSLPIGLQYLDYQTTYMSHCLMGWLYACLADRVRRRTGKPLMNLKRVKLLTMAVLFWNPADTGLDGSAGTRVGRAFRELYPAEAAAIVAHYEQHGHGHLARLMQANEANIMIRGVVARIFRERPDLPVLTVHDCLLVPPDAAEYAKRVVKEEWAKVLGVEPGVSVTDWTAPQEGRKKKKKKQATERNTRKAGRKQRPTDADLSNLRALADRQTGWVGRGTAT